MKVRVQQACCSQSLLRCCWQPPRPAHHEILAKFDDKKAMTLTRHRDQRRLAQSSRAYLHDRADGQRNVNWAIELASPIDLNHSGWTRDSVQPGESIKVGGIAARNGSRQVWGNTVVTTATSRQVLNVRAAAPPPPLAAGRRRAGPIINRGSGHAAVSTGTGGIRGHGADRERRQRRDDRTRAAQEHRRRAESGTDAAVGAGDLPDRQQRFLQDDPMFLNCKPPGGVRQFQSPYGLQFVEDRDRQRIFVLIGSGNRNYRIIYTDGRGHAGQVGGDDDNPLYYGRAVAQWEKDTLVVDTTGFNEDFWFTNGGLPHTDQLKLVERFTRENLDTLSMKSRSTTLALTLAVVERLGLFAG